MNWVVMLFGMFMVLNTPVDRLSKTAGVILVVWYIIALTLILTGLFYNQLVVLL